MKSFIINKNLKKEKSDRGKIDIKLLLLTVSLLILGTVIVFSSSYPYALYHYGDGYYFLKRQVIFLSIGLLGMFSISNLNIEILKKITPIFYLVCIILLVFVLIGGFSEGLAKRWLGIPGTPLSFQPSELMKLGIILMLGWWINKHSKAKKSFKNEIVVPGLILFSACGLVLLEKHLSGTIILALIGLCILFIAGTNVKKMILTYGLTGIIGATAFLLTNDYAMKRIVSFLDPNADKLSDKWQTTQGLYAIGSGGLFGKGIGNSIQKYSYVSEPQNDFIFTIWCEETGYIGAIIIIALFLLLVHRGYKIAFNSDDLFSSMIAFGITSQIGIQAFLNMAVVSDLIPNTGISLPFFSYGGSSLVILLAEMGILLSISRRVRC